MSGNRDSEPAPVDDLGAPVRTVMSAPLTVCAADTSLAEAFAMLRRHRIEALGVADDRNRLLGLLTYASLAEALLDGRVRPDSPAREAARPIRRVDAGAPLDTARDALEGAEADCLVVMADDRPLGLVSRAALRHRPPWLGRAALLAAVARADSGAALRDCRRRLPPLAVRLRRYRRSAAATVAVLSDCHLAIQRRCVELVLAELRDQGRGAPPQDYALIVMGALGRGETLLDTDQDNGIILAAEPAGPADREWFERFCDRLNRRLDEVGYPLCAGGIMARNPEYRQSLEQWRQRLCRAIRQPSPEAARWAATVFDFTLLYGEPRLVAALRAQLLDELGRRPRLLKLMVEDDADGRPALGLFRRLLTAAGREGRGRIDLKRNGTRLLADAARIYALAAGLETTQTDRRLRRLAGGGPLDTALADAARAAHDTLLDLALDHQLRQWRAGREPDKLLDPAELPVLDRERLRTAMSIVKRLQERLQSDFGTLLL